MEPEVETALLLGTRSIQDAIALLEAQLQGKQVSAMELSSVLGTLQEALLVLRGFVPDLETRAFEVTRKQARVKEHAQARARRRMLRRLSMGGDIKPGLTEQGGWGLPHPSP